MWDNLIGINNRKIFTLCGMISEGIIHVSGFKTASVLSPDNSSLLRMRMMKLVYNSLICFICTIIKNVDVEIGIGLFYAREDSLLLEVVSRCVENGDTWVKRSFLWQRRFFLKNPEHKKEAMQDSVKPEYVEKEYEKNEKGFRCQGIINT